MANNSIHRRLALICGVSNNRSVGWHCASSFLSEGYNVIVTCQERFESSVNKMIHQSNVTANDGKAYCIPCDVSCDKSVSNLFQHELFKHLNNSDDICLDALVHSIAYAPPDAMNSSILSTTRKSFNTSHDISSYSLILLARQALPFLQQKRSISNENINSYPHSSSSITTLTYLGSTRAVPNYNIMGPAKASLESTVRSLAMELGSSGVRVNAVSAPPISTISARGIQGFSHMKDAAVSKSPLKRQITSKEIGDFVTYIASGDKGSSAVTGQTLFVDGGYSISEMI